MISDSGTIEETHTIGSGAKDGAVGEGAKINLTEDQQAAREKTYTKLLRMHFAAFVFMGIQTIAYGVAGEDIDITTYPTIGIATQPTYCNGPICPPQTKTLKSMNPIWLITLFVALASFDHLVCFLVGKYYPTQAQHWLFVVGSNPLRWLEYSISASCMAWAIAILCGVHDIHLWLLIFAMTMIGMITGYLLEALPKSEENWTGHVSLKQIKNIIYWIGCTAIFMPWVVMLCYFFANVGQSADGVPDFVYAAFLVTLLLFITFGLNSLFHSVFKWYDFATAEMIYIILSFTAKTFLAADVFGGLNAASSD